MAGSSMIQQPQDFGQDSRGQHGAVRKIILDWVSDDAAGTASGATEKIVGQLVKVTTNPGSPAPTDNYGIVITDEDGIDVLAGYGGTPASLLNRDTANTETAHLFALNAAGEAMPGTKPIVCGPLTVSVTNAGNSKQGRITIYYVV